jgi:hypothetical protein
MPNLGRKIKDQQEQQEKIKQKVEDQRKAASSYVSPDPENMDTRQTLSGLPWGGISLKHIVKEGLLKQEQSSRRVSERTPYMKAPYTWKQKAGEDLVSIRLFYALASS